MIGKDTHRIKWTVKKTGSFGYSSGLFDEVTAKGLCDVANAKFIIILHTPEKVVK